jgi:hypothetical protein
MTYSDPGSEPKNRSPLLLVLGIVGAIVLLLVVVFALYSGGDHSQVPGQPDAPSGSSTF